MRHLLPLTAVVLLLFGCGDDAPTDEQQVRDTLTTFAAAVEGRDYQKLCDEVFADSLLEGIQQIGLPCEVAMRTGLGEREETKLTVGEVTVDGTTARAQIKTSATGEEPSQDTIELTKAGGRWRVSALGGAAAPTPTPTP